MANPNPKPPPKEHQFKPGNVANPGGKAVGTRDRITTQFLYKLAADFEKHGKSAIEETRTKDPAAYIKVLAGLLPKQIEQTKPLDDLNDAEVLALLDYLRNRVIENAGTGVGETGVVSQAH